jgi:hypothetical protein
MARLVMIVGGRTVDLSQTLADLNLVLSVMELILATDDLPCLHCPRLFACLGGGVERDTQSVNKPDAKEEAKSVKKPGTKRG